MCLSRYLSDERFINVSGDRIDAFYYNLAEGTLTIELLWLPPTHLYLDRNVDTSIPMWGVTSPNDDSPCLRRYYSLLQVVESLSLAIEEMHPDVEIVLVTFSNRIGVHK